MEPKKGLRLKIIGSSLKKVVKRDGRIETFDSSRIKNAITQAFEATNQKDGSVIKEIVASVLEELENRFSASPPHVEQIQDIVEQQLIKRGLDKVAKAYILYRAGRAKIREAKSFLGVQDDLKLSISAIKVLRSRYLAKNEAGETIETPSAMFRRVAYEVALADRLYKADSKKSEEEFYSALSNLEFLPNSPTLMNAGRPLGQLSACFVLPVGDSISEIFEAVKKMAQIHQSGGGTGFSFSRLRPRGDIVRSTMGEASGPVSFMEIFDKTTSVIKQGGRRRGANMGVLSINHPDIIDFITAKSDPERFPNFNISVAVTDKFMKQVSMDQDYELINPRTGKVVRMVSAKSIFDLIVTQAWRTGDPGLIFIDRINKNNPTSFLGPISATNPCGEQPLHDFESCNLGSINLVKFINQDKKDLDWWRLRKIVNLGAHFLDNVIDVNKFPFKETEKITKENRRVGLGIMGWAEVLAILKIPYDSPEALALARRLMRFITDTARKASGDLARTRGEFPNFKKSKWYGRSRPLRNATSTTIAPTGAISIIADVSSGIEPFFAISFVRNILEGAKFFEINKYFENDLKRLGIFSEGIIAEIAKTGSCQDIQEFPREVRSIYKTALDISPSAHVRMQAAFQQYTDNAVSKTINLPENSSPEGVREAFLLAYKLGCKGITVYRYGSKPKQVLYLGGGPEGMLSADVEYAGGCPEPFCPY